MEPDVIVARLTLGSLLIERMVGKAREAKQTGDDLAQDHIEYFRSETSTTTFRPAVTRARNARNRRRPEEETRMMRYSIVVTRAVEIGAPSRSTTAKDSLHSLLAEMRSLQISDARYLTRTFSTTAFVSALYLALPAALTFTFTL